MSRRTQTDSGVDQDVLNQVDARIEHELDFWLARLGDLVKQPSVSSQGVGMEEAADLVAAMLAHVGIDARIMQTAGFPVVYGEAAGRGGEAMLFYNHYDVQPAEPLGLWDSPPFACTRRDGKIFGRGVVDDKGHIISRLHALSAVRSVLGELPCPVKFMIEGEEEISSPNVPSFVEQHRNLLTAGACVWESGGVGYDGRPMIMLGMRGILYVQYDVRTMARDAHSGTAHLLPNAAWRLLNALQTIRDENDRITIDGFYDDCEGMTDLDRRFLEEMTVDHERMRRSYGVDRFNGGLDGYEAKEAVFWPTANIAGLSAGYEGEGAKTVIPSFAMAKMDFRLVPNQDPQDIFKKLRAHLDRNGFGDVELRFLGGEAPARTPADHRFVRLTRAAADAVYGMPANINPLVGGSGPIHAFRHYLDIPVVSIGIGYPESMAHAPNEHIRVDDYLLGTHHMARVLLGFPSIG